MTTGREAAHPSCPVDTPGRTSIWAHRLVATVVNHSQILLDDTNLTVTHGPLPWPAPVPVPLDAIDQLYLVQRVVQQGRTYTLVVRLKDKTSVELVDTLSDDTQARYMERKIEAHLGPQNVDVLGEYTG